MARIFECYVTDKMRLVNCPRTYNNVLNPCVQIGLELLAGGQAVEGRGASGAISGNFILDREFIAEEEMKDPLVLLD